MGSGRTIDADVGFIRFLKRSGGADVKKCFQCATCSAVCNLSPAEKPFPRKEMLLAGWGQAEKLAKDPDIWLCHQCNDCSTYCPRGAKPGDVLAAIRSYVFQHFAFPSFMGKALASPKALPWLILAPMIIIGLLLLGRKPDFTQGQVIYDHFISVHWLEPLFIGGNILVFFCAFMGLWRFWNGLESPSAKAEVGFVKGAIEAVKDILTHANFFECDENKSRAYAHLLVFFGFCGAAMTAGMGAMALKVLGIESPYTFDHPMVFVRLIKWIGNLSAIAGIAGTIWLLVRRFTDPENVGANGYQDWLFLIVIFLAFITGFLTQVVRMTGADIAFLVYYIHLVVVFFLLWYAPYSKFAHMFYRSLAFVHARSAGRGKKERP
ncbi:MAG: quinone-interacting membrane-bound oxidoreductase complex subunit QmoC [Elusimicrobiota bacterium]